MDFSGAPFYLNEEQMQWVDDTLSSLSLRQKVGQLFCIMGGGHADEELASLAADYCIGGVLFRPAPAHEILKKFEILDKNSAIPLLKAANLEEGGSGAISEGTFFGWPMGVSATNDLTNAHRLAKVCANEGRSVGINWTFSPVTDICYHFMNPITNVRSFGSDPDQVLEYCSEYVKTIQAEGIAACAKHFPGDGVDFRDHHLHPSYNTLPADEWYATFGRNYKQLIDEGLASIMVGHIVQPNVAMQINPELTVADCLPSSLSREMLQGVLRDQFGFNGVICSDATIMQGFKQAMERKRGIPSAIAAGCDMLVFNVDFYEDYQFMLDGIADGILSMERLDEAVSRILAMKAYLAKNQELTEIDPQNRLWCKECTDKSITLVKDIQNAIPVRCEDFDEIRIIPLGDDRMYNGESMTQLVRNALSDKGFHVTVFNEQTDRIKNTLSIPKRRLSLYICNIGAISNNTAVRLYWPGRGAPMAPHYVHEEKSIFISFGYPYHLMDVPRVRTYINCYSCNETTIDAVINKLVGKSEFVGVSPVDASCGLPDTML